MMHPPWIEKMSEVLEPTNAVDVVSLCLMHPQHKGSEAPTPHVDEMVKMSPYTQ